MRVNTVVPVLLSRELRKENRLEINVDGVEYILPDKAIITSNVLGMQMNPRLWNNPDKFDVNRWLDEDGKFNRKLNSTMINFSFGYKDCP